MRKMSGRYNPRRGKRRNDVAVGQPRNVNTCLFESLKGPRYRKRIQILGQIGLGVTVTLQRKQRRTVGLGLAFDDSWRWMDTLWR
jgi:hypothetical protein